MTRGMRITLILLMLLGIASMFALAWPTSVKEWVITVGTVTYAFVFYTFGLINWVAYNRSFLGRRVRIVGCPDEHR